MNYSVANMARNFKNDGPNLWTWGDWYITCVTDGFHLCVSSGVTYGPFKTWVSAIAKAADVAI